MICRLCLEIPENPDNCLDIASDMAIQSNIAAILYKYFKFCFNNEPHDGFVCEKCWWKVEMFHLFYTRIECAHENVLIEKIDDEISAQNFEYECKNFVQNLGDNVQCGQTANTVNGSKLLEVKKPPKQKTSKLKEVSGDSARQKPTHKSNSNSKLRTKSTSNIFHCTTCALPFLTEYKLYIHIKEVHAVQQFKCDEAKCVESYVTQQQLDDHIQQSHSRVTCPHCDKLIKLYYLPLHIKFYHDADQRIVCDLCGHVSSNNNMFKSHIRLVHEQQERLQCDICKDWCRNKNSMREHMRVRHIQKPESCQICGKMSANKKALMKHKKFHFAEARERFKCTVCSRGFRDSTKLKEHSYIHTGISVYRCSCCEKIFRFASSMYAHRKKAHPSNDLKPQNP